MISSTKKYLGVAGAVVALGAVGAATTTAAAAPAKAPYITSTAMSFSSYDVVQGQAVTAYVTVKGYDKAHAPSGTVTIAHGSTVYAVGKVANGKATVTFVDNVPAQNFGITATYNGDTANAASRSRAVNLSVEVSHHAAIHVSFTPTTIGLGGTSQAGVTVPAPYGGPTPTGRVQLVEVTSGTKVGLTTRTLVDGHATIPYTASTVGYKAYGTHSFIVVYSGDSYYDSFSQSGRVTLVVAD